MEKLWSASVYYYGTSEIVKNTFKMSVQFADTIDMDIMRKALDMTQKRYPYFSIKRVRTVREIQLEDNKLPWVLKESEEPMELGGKESNFHMIAFRCKGNWLYIDVFHGLTDGTGIMNLLRTLSYYYCREVYDKTISSKGVWLVENPVLPEETKDPYRSLPQREPLAAATSEKKQTEYMDLAEENQYDCTKPYVFRLEIPQKDLMKYCGENDGSPATAIALFIARAIKKIHKDSPKTIGCGMATNLRKVLGTKNSHQSTVTMPILDFTEQISESTLELQGTAFRGQVMLKCDVDALRNGVYASNTFYGFIDSIPTCQEKEQIMRRTVEKVYKSSTASISYVGKSNLGACEKYIRQIFSETAGAGIMLELNALNDVFCLAFIQEWEERTYFERFCSELRECGITYTLKSEGTLTLPKLAEL